MPRSTRRSFLRLGLAVAAPLALGVSLRPSLALAAPDAQAFDPFWVQNFVRAELWSGPNARAASLGHAELFTYFKVLVPQRGPRLHVFNPLTDGTAWIPAAAVGPSGEPPAAYLNPPAPTPTMAAPAALPAGRVNLPGRVIGGANLRGRPQVAPDSLLKNLPHNSLVQVLDDVIGADGEKWYRVGDGQFVHHSLVKLPKSFPPHPGKVIEADLNEPVLVTAYEDGKAVYSALAMKGTVAWATPTGFFKISRRVANETMDSATLGIPRNAPGGYFLKDVLNTQYFTADGASIHYNWWSSNFGYSGSHGCLGMNLADSEFFWNWGSVGIPLFIHY